MIRKVAAGIRIIATSALLSCSDNGHTIKIKGSDTEVNLVVQLSEAFHREHAQNFVSISGGGSGLGIASLLNGTADIANSSRSIHQDERQLFLKRKIDIDSFVFARDAIAFVVAKEIQIDSISVSALAKLLDGTYSSWVSLTGQDLPVTIYGRQSNSGTHDYVMKKLAIHFSARARQMNGNAQILEAIKSDHSGIGYVGAGYVMKGDRGLKIIRIYQENEIAYSPLIEVDVMSHHYYFQRPLFQYYRKEKYNQIKGFLDFERSADGLSIIKASGYYIPEHTKTQ